MCVILEHFVDINKMFPSVNFLSFLLVSTRSMCSTVPGWNMKQRIDPVVETGTAPVLHLLRLSGSRWERYNRKSYGHQVISHYKLTRECVTRTASYPQRHDDVFVVVGGIAGDANLGGGVGVFEFE